jgi:predicted hotdog family 3-hydroxylacyl-ACP dehydratase
MPIISKADLRRLIPHQGRMCLLDTVEQWDQISITCRTASHRDASNPLRRDNHLEAICGLEYAAQAMGVHVGLLEQGRKPHNAVGYLGAVRNLTLRASRLDNVKEDLTIHATRLAGQRDGFIYTFRVSAGEQELLDGRASIFLKDLDQQP